MDFEDFVLARPIKAGVAADGTAVADKEGLCSIDHFQAKVARTGSDSPLICKFLCILSLQKL